MRIKFNKVFKQLLSEYGLSEDFTFSVEIPLEVQKILNDKILITDLGITLNSFNGLYKAIDSWENQSTIEDNENHFHIECYLDNPNNKSAFMLGIKTLILLAEKFNRENIKDVRFLYSFQTPELGKLWAIQNNLDEEGEEHFISDRLSFFKIRKQENLYTLIQNDFWAILTIDI